ncbi:MAG TPA: putative selenate ABC transporter substrate-binding protein [Planctomycetes bacterium]|nr:putative selenate ABC transporter substrate-binding protein [Planctomycetota bacterium]HIL38161.1 putative selenate ABC transporter substrate-binding protein [Planctomycetota bacterium]
MNAPRPFLLLSCLLALGLPAACGGSQKALAAGRTLRFSAIPHERSSAMAEQLAQVAKYLQRELDLACEYVPVSDYAAAVEAFKNKDVDLAWFGGVTGVQARKAMPGSRAIAQGRVDPEFKSYFIAHVDSGIAPSDEFPTAMEGRSFSFGSPGSTSGRLMPEFFLRQATGKTPQEFFGHLNRYSGSHNQTALQVQNQTVDCGALNYKTYESMVSDGRLDPEVCLKIWETPPYPDYNWTVRGDLDDIFGAGLTAALQDALVNCDDPQVLAALKRPEGLIPACNEDFTAVAQTMAAVGMLPE